jgi:hypothetical protein
MSERELSAVEGTAAGRPVTMRLIALDDDLLCLEWSRPGADDTRVEFPRGLAAAVGDAVRAITSEEENEEIELRGGGELITVHPVTHPFGCDAMVENRARHPRGYAHQAQHVMVAVEMAGDVAGMLDGLATSS